jgi:hypothetical protein
MYTNYKIMYINESPILLAAQRQVDHGALLHLVRFRRTR